MSAQLQCSIHRHLSLILWKRICYLGFDGRAGGNARLTAAAGRLQTGSHRGEPHGVGYGPPMHQRRGIGPVKNVAAAGRVDGLDRQRRLVQWNPRLFVARIPRAVFAARDDHGPTAGRPQR